MWASQFVSWYKTCKTDPAIVSTWTRSSVGCKNTCAVKLVEQMSITLPIPSTDVSRPVTTSLFFSHVEFLPRNYSRIILELFTFCYPDAKPRQIRQSFIYVTFHTIIFYYEKKLFIFFTHSKSVISRHFICHKKFILGYVWWRICEVFLFQWVGNIQF